MKWISVKDQLPEEDSLVVGSDGATEYSSYAVFDFFNGKFYLQTEGLDASNYDGGAVIRCCFDVSHWYPLPAKMDINK